MISAYLPGYCFEILAASSPTPCLFFLLSGLLDYSKFVILEAETKAAHEVFPWLLIFSALALCSSFISVAVMKLSDQKWFRFIYNSGAESTTEGKSAVIPHRSTPLSIWEAQQEPWKMLLVAWLAGTWCILCELSCMLWDHPPRDGNTHSGLGFATSIRNQDNLPRPPLISS